MSQQPPPSESPKVIDGRYREVRLLGQGGFGRVSECQHVGMPRRFAVKVLLPEHASKPGVRERFLREAQTAGGIKSPHVIDVFDVGECRATRAPYIAMELLDGEDLGATLERGPLAPDVVLRIAVQGLSGLCAAHALGIVHRDLKPSNLFLARAGGGIRCAKLLDFGIAKVMGEKEQLERAKLTMTGAILGSGWYMSPEQVFGRADIDHRTDIYSFGALLYEALAGQPPYGDAPNIHMLLRMIGDGPPRPLAELAPRVPPALGALVMKAMAHDRESRFQTAAEMLAAVRQLHPGDTTITDAMIGAPEAPASVVPSSQAAIAFGATQPAPTGSTNAGLARSIERTPRRRYVIGGVAVIACLTLAALVLTFVPPPGSRSATTPDAAVSELVSAQTAPAVVPDAATGSAEASPSALDAGAPEDAGTPADAGPRAAPPKTPPKSPATATTSKSSDPFKGKGI